jgi:hypothetical protein
MNISRAEPSAALALLCESWGNQPPVGGKLDSPGDLADLNSAGGDTGLCCNGAPGRDVVRLLVLANSLRSNNIRNDCSPRSSSSSSRGGAYRTRLLLFVTPIVFAALAGTADGAITNCNKSTNQWVQIEDGYYCQASGWCSSGWTWASYHMGAFCSRDGCTREICDECVAGYHKSGYSHGYPTACQKCSHIEGCSTSVKCTTSSDSECYSCYAI